MQLKLNMLTLFSHLKSCFGLPKMPEQALISLNKERKKVVKEMMNIRLEIIQGIMGSLSFGPIQGITIYYQ